jgi:hypothetical protein
MTRTGDRSERCAVNEGSRRLAHFVEFASAQSL